MAQSPDHPEVAEHKAKGFSFRQRIKEIDLFFEGRGREHKAMRRLARRLNRAGISYAIVGGMAVHLHRHFQTTQDVDLLLCANGLEEFKQRYVPKCYEPVPGRPRRFIDRINRIMFDVVIAGHFPGRNGPGPIAYPEPESVSEIIDEVRVVNLVTLIQLKLAAGRYHDLGDVASLIDVHGLDESYLEHLHPSVRQSFMKCLEEKRRQDEFDSQS